MAERFAKPVAQESKHLGDDVEVQVLLDRILPVFRDVHGEIAQLRDGVQELRTCVQGMDWMREFMSGPPGKETLPIRLDRLEIRQTTLEDELQNVSKSIDEKPKTARAVWGLIVQAFIALASIAATIIAILALVKQH